MVQGGITITLNSPAPAEIETSSDLWNWMPLAGATNLANGVFLQPLTNAEPQRFYRARLLRR
jgi:hypothetical protein